LDLLRLVLVVGLVYNVVNGSRAMLVVFRWGEVKFKDPRRTA